MTAPAPREGSLSSLSPSHAKAVRARLLGVLLASRWPRQRQWPGVVVCVTPDAPDRVVTRAELASDFRNAGDAAAAHEVLARRVPAGSCLMWLVLDSAEDAGAGLVVVDLLGAR